MDEQKKNSNKKVKKFYIILGMLLILLIPIAFLSGIVDDRENYRNKAVNQVELAWASAQTIFPPELKIFIPGKKETVEKTLELNNYEAEVKVKTELFTTLTSLNVRPFIACFRSCGIATLSFNLGLKFMEKTS